MQSGEMSVGELIFSFRLTNYDDEAHGCHLFDRFGADVAKRQRDNLPPVYSFVQIDSAIPGVGYMDLNEALWEMVGTVPFSRRAFPSRRPMAMTIDLLKGTSDQFTRMVEQFVKQLKLSAGRYDGPSWYYEAPIDDLYLLWNMPLALPPDASIMVTITFSDWMERPWSL